jgi:hypothetical protein
VYSVGERFGVVKLLQHQSYSTDTVTTKNTVYWFCSCLNSFNIKNTMIRFRTRNTQVGACMMSVRTLYVVVLLFLRIVEVIVNLLRS